MKLVFWGEKCRDFSAVALVLRRWWLVAVKPCAFPYSFRGLLLPVALTLVFAFAFALLGMETPVKGLCLPVYFHSPVTTFIIGGIFTLLSTCSVPLYHTRVQTCCHPLTGLPHNHEQPLSGVRSLIDARRMVASVSGMHLCMSHLP